MKISIISGAYSLTSELKVEDIVLLKKYNPDALSIKDEDGNTKFAIGYSEGKPSVSSFGITFGSKSFEGGKASLTKSLPANMSDAATAKDYVAEEFGAVVAYLKQLEESVPEAVKKIKDDKKAIVDSITVG